MIYMLAVVAIVGLVVTLPVTLIGGLWTLAWIEGRLG